MMKYVAPLRDRLRHVYAPTRRPSLFRAHLHGIAGAAEDGEVTRGQRVAEQSAAFLGSWRFIGLQAAAMCVWVVWNVLTPLHLRFDQFPFVFLNLAMSAEAAFTGPVILIAAAVGALRDHAQARRVEQLVQQNEALAERIVQMEESLLLKLDALGAPGATPPPPKRRKQEDAA